MSRNAKRKRPTPSEEDAPAAVGFYESYANFSRNLRAWLLAYGVGGPVIFLTNEAAGKKLMASGEAETIATYFLAGVALQIFATWLYKWAMWFLYSGEKNPEFQAHRLHRWADNVSECYACELALDIVTIILFLVATWRVLRATLALG